MHRDSQALRSKRSRLHRRGDHLLCKPERCPEAQPSTSQPPPKPRPMRMPGAESGRGARLYADLNVKMLPPGHRVLAEEACRLTDRLDVFDRVISGEIECVEGFDLPAVHREARITATALRGLIYELRAAMLLNENVDPPAEPEDTEDEQDTPAGVSDLLERIDARRSQTAG